MEYFLNIFYCRDGCEQKLWIHYSHAPATHLSLPINNVKNTSLLKAQSLVCRAGLVFQIMTWKHDNMSMDLFALLVECFVLQSYEGNHVVCGEVGNMSRVGEW